MRYFQRGARINEGYLWVRLATLSNPERESGGLLRGCSSSSCAGPRPLLPRCRI